MMTEPRKLFFMLVDDSEVDLFLHEKFIERKGISELILKFAHASEALDFLYEKDREGKGWPDVILLDIQMPLMDGFEFLSKYERFSEELKQSTHIIMVSSSLDFGDTSRAKANPHVLDLLKKPLNTEELLRLLYEYKILNKPE